MPLAIVAISCCLASCNYDPRPGPAAEATAAALAAKRRGIWVRPPEIVKCGAVMGTTGEIGWNFGGPAGAQQVRIDVRQGRQGEARSFAGGGPHGTASTGPWLAPGMQFIARDTRTDRVLGMVEVGTYPCG